MAQVGEVRSALATVRDPELDRSIVELGLVRGVAVDGGTAVVALALPLPGEALRAELERRVIDAAGAVEGIDRVDVDVRAMTDDEARQAAGVLDAADARRHGAARAHRRGDRATGGQRRASDLDGLLRPRGPGGDLAWPDAAQGARAVPHRRLLERARLPRRRHAAGYR